MSENAQKAKIRMLALEILAGSKRGDFAPDCFDALADRVSDCLRAEDGLKLPHQLQCEATGAPRREAYLTGEERDFLSKVYREFLDEGYIALKQGAYNIEATRFVVCQKIPTK
jgi:hypothetical protein